MPGLEDLYREIILDHYRSRGTVASSPRRPPPGRGLQPAVRRRDRPCTSTSRTTVVADIRIGGQGCSISQSSASMMSAAVKGKTLDEVRAAHPGLQGDDVDPRAGARRRRRRGATAAEPDPDVKLGDLEALRGVVKFPVRIKCATLSWNTPAAGARRARRLVTEARPHRAPALASGHMLGSSTTTAHPGVKARSARSPAPPPLTIGGLVKHMALVEDSGSQRSRRAAWAWDTTAAASARLPPGVCARGYGGPQRGVRRTGRRRDHRPIGADPRPRPTPIAGAPPARRPARPAGALDHALGEHVHLVGAQLVEQPAVVGDGEHAEPVSSVAASMRRDSAQGVDVEARVELVEDGDRGLEHAELQGLVALLLAAGEVDVEGPVRKRSSKPMRSASATDRGRRRRPVGPAAPRRRPRARRRSDTPGTSIGYCMARKSPAWARSTAPGRAGRRRRG